MRPFRRYFRLPQLTFNCEGRRFFRTGSMHIACSRLYGRLFYSAYLKHFWRPFDWTNSMRMFLRSFLSRTYFTFSTDNFVWLDDFDFVTIKMSGNVYIDPVYLCWQFLHNIIEYRLNGEVLFLQECLGPGLSFRFNQVCIDIVCSLVDNIVGHGYKTWR